MTPTFVLPENVTLASLNTTGKAKVDILFFNRVPKVRIVRTNFVSCDLYEICPDLLLIKLW